MAADVNLAPAGSWRSNDILWGRLDGLCQITETLLTWQRLRRTQEVHDLLFAPNGSLNAPYRPASLFPKSPELAGRYKDLLRKLFPSMSDPHVVEDLAALQTAHGELVELLVEGLLVTRDCLLASLGTSADRVRESWLYKYGLNLPLLVFFALAVLWRRAPRALMVVLIGPVVLSVIALGAGIVWAKPMLQGGGQLSPLWVIALLLVPFVLIFASVRIAALLAWRLQPAWEAKMEAPTSRNVNVWLAVTLVSTGIAGMIVGFTGIDRGPAAFLFAAGIFAGITEIAAIDVGLLLADRPTLVFDPPMGHWDFWPWPIIAIVIGFGVGWRLWG